jgi:tol-pal system beta propeller repeat protein TolB
MSWPRPTRLFALGIVVITGALALGCGQGTGHIVFVSGSNSDYGKDIEINIMNEDGTGLKRLTFNSVRDLYPTLSPDGSEVAFQSEREGEFEIYVMNTEGHDVRQLTFASSGRAMYPSWSPDGERIAFMSKTEIYVINVDGTGQSQITNNADHSYSFPRWSPDGERIAFVSDLGGEVDRETNSEIFVMNVNGTGLKRLTYSYSYDASPSWSPDGSSIAFVARSPEGVDRGHPNRQIWVMSAGGGSEIRLTHNEFEDLNPDWSPDGHQIIFERGVNKPGGPLCFELYVMDSDGSNQKPLTSDRTCEGRGWPRWVGP